MKKRRLSLLPSLCIIFFITQQQCPSVILVVDSYRPLLHLSFSNYRYDSSDNRRQNGSTTSRYHHDHQCHHHKLTQQRLQNQKRFTFLLLNTHQNDNNNYDNNFNTNDKDERSNSFLKDSTMTEITKTEATTTTSSDSSSTSCPYAMMYPRYRIDLTTPQQKMKQQQQQMNTNNGLNPVMKLVSLSSSVFNMNSSSSSKKGLIQNDLQKIANNNNSNIKKNDSNPIKIHTILEWIPKEDTLQAYSTMWKILAQHVERIQSESINTEQTSTAVATTTTTTTRSEKTIIVVCFPDIQGIVLQNWNEIYQWMATEQNTFVASLLLDQDHSSTKDTTTKSESRMNIQTEYKDSYNVPRIEISITKTFSIIENETTTIRSNMNEENNNHEYYNHDIITQRTQMWVKRILVEQGICPFTKSVKRSGHGLTDVNVPVANIAYHTSQSHINLSSSVDPSVSLLIPLIRLQADVWDAIVNMILIKGPNGRNGISSILLAAPTFDEYFNVWSSIVFSTLEYGVIATQSTNSVGVVCFHPNYLTPDGTTFPGFGHMHSVPRLQAWYNDNNNNNNNEEQNNQQDILTTATPTSTTTTVVPSSSSNLSWNEIAAGGAYQRRTPHATVNVLRADQLSAAESKRNTPVLYSNNIRTLIQKIGIQQLQHDLQKERNKI